MSKSIGIVMTGRITSGLVVDEKRVGELREWPHRESELDAMQSLPADGIAEQVSTEVRALMLASGVRDLDAIGVAVPGIVRRGIVEDSPNVLQLKGARLAETLTAELERHGVSAPVFIMNDADAMAAGIAATRGKLDRLIRVWTLGNGVGYGRYPAGNGIWEGGHVVVTMDPRENYCGCGGRGHLEGIAGYRAMRMRFLDMEPEEVFANAAAGDAKCMEFKRLWHCALAAATANSIHMSGPGRFYFTGKCSVFLDMRMLEGYLQQMVKMTPLQKYTMEMMGESRGEGVVGAAVSAEDAAAMVGTAGNARGDRAD
jgi:glucokinase